MKTKHSLRESEIQGRSPGHGLNNRLGKNSSWVLKMLRMLSYKLTPTTKKCWLWPNLNIFFKGK